MIAKRESQEKHRRHRSMGLQAKVLSQGIKATFRAVWLVLWLSITLVRQGAIPKQGPVVVVGNHLSFIDPLLWVTLVRRNGAMLAKAELWQNWFVRLLVKIRGDIPVDRGSDEQRDWALQEAKSILARGGVVGGYPEGGIRGGQWRTGLFSAARQHQATIVVVRLVGTDIMVPSTKADIKKQGGRMFSRRAKVTAIQSIAYPYAEYAAMTDQEAAAFFYKICEGLAA